MSAARWTPAATRWQVSLPGLSVGTASASLLASAAVGYLVGAGEWVTSVALLLGAVLVATGAFAPAMFVLGLLLVRPLLDRFTESDVALGGFNVNAAAAAGILAAVVLAIALARGRLQIRPPGTAAFAWVLVVSSLAAVLALADLGSEVQEEPLVEIVRLTAIFAVFLLATNYLSDRRRLTALFVAVGLSAVVPALAGVYEVLSGSAAPAAGLTIQRAMGTFTGPNAYGEFLALTAIVLIGLPRSHLSSTVRIGALIPVLVALTASFSRTGWAMFALGVLVLMLPRHKRLLTAGLIAAVILALAVPAVRERAMPGGTVAETEAPSDTSGSFGWRLETWRILLEKVPESPIVGFGLTSAPVVNPRQAVIPGGVERVGYDPHNAILKLLVEGGIPLLVAWAVLIAVIVTKLFRLVQTDWPLRDHARLVLTLWIMVIAAGLAADDPLVGTALMYALFALTGAIFGARALGEHGAYDFAPSGGEPGRRK